MKDFEDLIERFDHVAYAVDDVRPILPLIEFLGGTFLYGADNVRNHFRWVQFRLPGDAKLEVIAPLDEDSFLTRFLRRRGAGIHHLTFKVRDLGAAARRADELGFTTTGYHESENWSEVFLHPSSAHGAVIQLAEWADDSHWAGPALEDVLAGRVLDFD